MIYGIAILQTPTNNIDERGYYIEPEPYWNKRYMAEFVIDNKKELMEYLIAEINHNIREALIVKESVRLLSEYVDIPEMNKIQPDLEFFKNIPCYNDFISLLPYSISRSGRYKNERPLEDIKKEIDDVFRPFDLESLYPTKEAIEKAKGIVNLNIIKGRIEDLFEVLRGEA